MSKRGGYRMATLDSGKRVKVVSHDGVDGYVCRWTSGCSGCGDDREGVSSHQGSGCSECGYTGKRVQGWWEPLDPMWWAKLDAKCEPEMATVLP